VSITGAVLFIFVVLTFKSIFHKAFNLF